MPENDELNLESGDSADKKKKPGRKKRVLLRANTTFSDAKLAEKSRVWLQFFKEDEAAFIALDSAFGGTFAADWLADIELFERQPTTENMLDEQQQYALDAEKVRKKYLSALQTLDYYLPKAFPDTLGLREEYGLNKVFTNDYKRGNRALVLGFAILELANDSMPQLIAAGMPAAWAADTQTLLNNYIAKEVLYEKQKIKTVRNTNARIRLYNKLYAIHMQVAKAAEVIFNGSKTKIDLYR